MVWKDTKAGPNADSRVEIGICTNHRLRLVTATVTLGPLAGAKSWEMADSAAATT